MFKKIRIEYVSPFKAIPTADQLFGHIVWAISDIYGEEAASKFVEQVPVRISSALPEGFFPIPVLPSKRKENDDAIDQRNKAKRNKDLHWISLMDFSFLQSGVRSLSDLDLSSCQPIIKTIEETRVSIDRTTMKASDGQLYSEEYLYPMTLAFYADFIDEDKFPVNAMKEVLKVISINGIGGNRNIGRGQCKLTIEELSDLENKIFNFTSDSSSFMTLSKCAGMNLDPISYRIEVFSGIVGRTYEGQGFYNKRPIALYDIGSTFFSGEGGMFNEMSTDPKVSTYAYAFPVRINYA